jgi:integrase
VVQAADSFDALVQATLATVAPSSARIYRQTFQYWQDWCRRQGVDPLILTAANVRQYLLEQSVSQSTRQRQLSALRKLARVLALDYTNPARRAAYESLLLLRTPKEGVTIKERSKRALSPAQADRVLRAWDDDTLIQQRNCALIAVLFLSGLRRSEVAQLQWADIDLDEGVIHIRHGKGDTARDVALAGDYALEALANWRNAQGESRLYVFCSITKGSKLGDDCPMTAQAVYNVIKATERKTGVAFSPHDARRTFITEALATGAALADVQAQAGHKQESTTLRYAKPVDARQRRTKLRLRYGS